MQAFWEVLQRLDEVNVAPEFRETFVKMIKDMDNYFSSKEDKLSLNFGEVFNKFLFNNLTIRSYWETDEKLNGEGGCYMEKINTICLNKNTDETHLCHEFIHFIIHNQYATNYFGDRLPLPTFLDEYATQSLATRITNSPESVGYKTMISLVDFANRHSSPQVTLEDFLNGKLNDYWENNLLFSNLATTFNEISNNSTEQLESKVVLGVLRHSARDFLQKNKDASFEDFVQHLVTLECENIESGEIDGHREVGSRLTQEDREQFYLKYNIVKRFIKSKGIESQLDEQTEQDANKTVQNYVVAKLKENHNNYCEERSQYSFTKEEQMALNDIVEVNNMMDSIEFYQKNEQQCVKF